MVHRHLFKNRASCCSAPVIAMFVISGLAHGGTVLFVDDDAPQGGDGTTWDTAYRFLQDALADASGGGVTEVRVGQGTYKPDRDEANPNGTGDSLATYQILSDVAVVGGFAGIGAPDPDERDVNLYQTILSGDIGILEEETDNCNHVVTGTGVTSTGVLDGFTITLGFAHFGAWPQYVGGGMLIFGSGNPTIANCLFIDNAADSGGAIWVENAAMTATSTRFTNNRAFDGVGGAIVGNFATITAVDCVFEANTADRGGAVLIGNSATSSFTNCTFTANEALFDGGAIRAYDVPVTLIDCSFTKNVALGDNTSSGGALSLLEGSDADVQGCSFVGNSALSGGAVWVKDSTPSFADCNFDQNTAQSAGAISTSFGTSANLTNCVFTDNVAAVGDGGAVSFGNGSTSIVTNCQFINNSARQGGGLRTDQNAEPIITGCTFIGNTASMRGGGFFGRLGTMSDCLFDGNTATDRGGGAFCADDDSNILNCTFVNNSAQEGGGLAIGDDIFVADCTFTGNAADNGGAIFARQDQPTFLRCFISGNTANANGGGFYLTTDTLALVVGCTIVGNTASLAGGGAFVFDDSIPTFVNCRFSGNLAATNGGGINFFNTDGTVTCCSFNANEATQSGGGIWTSRPTILRNSILWGNSDDQGQLEDSQIYRWQNVQILLDYCCVQGLTGDLGGTGNIGNDPLFVDPEGPDGIPGTEDDDLHLLSGSPCIDAGNNWGVPIDSLDYDEDGLLCELFPVDMDGSPRFNADEADFDPGCGIPVVVDMGAYEYQFDPADQVTFADLNGDGAVGVKDLLGLLGSWGLCGKGCCLADLDINGNVGVTDLLILLGAWGPCPL